MVHWCAYPPSCSHDWRRIGCRYIFFSVNIRIRVCSHKIRVYWGVLRWNMAQLIIHMSIKHSLGKLLVNILVIFNFVSTRSRCIKSISTQSHNRKYLISMCLVQGVGFCAFPIALQVSLFSCITIAASCGMPRSHRILHTYRIILPVSYTAMNSASVDDPAMVG